MKINDPKAVMPTCHYLKSTSYDIRWQALDTLAHLKDPRAAESIYPLLFEKNDNSPELARVLGEISARAGKSSEALDYYGLAIRLGPQDYRNHLALFFASSSTFTPRQTRSLFWNRAISAVPLSSPNC